MKLRETTFIFLCNTEFILHTFVILHPLILGKEQQLKISKTIFEKKLNNTETSIENTELATVSLVGLAKFPEVKSILYACGGKDAHRTHQ